MVVPPGAVWPLPAYELALMTAGEARAMGHDDVEVTVVTPEREALSLFGKEASAAVAGELVAAGIDLRTGVVGRVEPGGLALEPGGEHLEVQRVFAVPRLLGPCLEGLPADDEGFIVAGDDARVEGCERTWAAGDGVVSPVKFGGLATHQARRAVAAIARWQASRTRRTRVSPCSTDGCWSAAGTRRLAGRGDAEGAPLWWPRARWRASTCPAGWPSTGSHRRAPRSRPRRA